MAFRTQAPQRQAREATRVDGRAPRPEGPTSVSAPIKLGNIHLNSDAVDTRFHKTAFHVVALSHSALGGAAGLRGVRTEATSAPLQAPVCLPLNGLHMRECQDSCPQTCPQTGTVDRRANGRTGLAFQWGGGGGRSSGFTVNLPCGSRKGPVPWASCPHTRPPAPRRACG